MKSSGELMNAFIEVSYTKEVPKHVGLQYKTLLLLHTGEEKTTRKASKHTALCSYAFKKTELKCVVCKHVKHVLNHNERLCYQKI